MWRGPRLLPLELVARPAKEGGLGIIPLKTKNYIVLSQWFRLLRHGGELWCEALKEEINKLGGIIALRRKAPTGEKWESALPCFKTMIEALVSIGNWAPKDEYVWGNKCIVPLSNDQARLSKNGYNRIGDFVDADGRIREAREQEISFAEKMEWVRVTNAIKKSYTAEQLTGEITLENDITAFSWLLGKRKIAKNDLDSKNITRALFSMGEGNDTARTRIKFNLELGRELCTMSCMKSIMKHTNIPRIKSFFIRFINSTAWSNKQYFRFKKIESPQCHGCNVLVQERVHLYFDCPKTIRFYSDVLAQFDGNVRKTVSKWLSQEEDVGKSYLIGFSIYFCHRENLRKCAPGAEAFFQWLDKIQKIEQQIAIGNDRNEFHVEKWSEIIDAIK